MKLSHFFCPLLLHASRAFALNVPSATQTSAPALSLMPTPNPVSAYQNRPIAAAEAFHTVTTLTTKSMILTSRTPRAVRVTAVQVNDGPAPTIVYNCKNMVDICYNTNKFAGTEFEQREDLYLFSYDGSSSRNQQRRKYACPDRGFPLRQNGCNGSFESPFDWGTTCDEAPPASMWEAGVGAMDIGASDRTQKRQGSLLSGLARLFSNDGTTGQASKNFKNDGRLHQVYFSLNYDKRVPSTEYGTLFAGGAKLKSDSSPGGSVVVNGPQQGATKSNQNAYTYTKPVTIVQQVAKCSDCSRPTGKPSLAADNLSSEAKKPQCKRTSRDRSQDKSSKAKKALDIAKRIYNQLQFDTSIADSIKDQIERALILAIGAVGAAETLAFYNDSTEEDQDDADAYAQQAAEAASQLAQSSNNGDVQSLQSMVASAAQEASSAASIASTFLAQPTGGGDGGNGGSGSGGNGNGDGDGGGSENGDGGDTSCVPSGSTRQINFGASGVSPICFNSQEVSVSSGSSGRVILKSTDTSDGDYYAGLEPDKNTNCNVFRFTPTKSGSTEWIGDCGAGHVIPYLSNSRMVVGVASSKSGIPLLAIAGKDQSSLDCFARSIVNGNFNSGGFFTVGPNPNGCRVVNNAFIPDPSTLFNSSAASQ